MSITSGPLRIIDHKKDCFQIKVTTTLSGKETIALREEIVNCIAGNYDIIYIDIKDVTDIDLSGINEIINSHYTLQKASKKLILLYRKNSVVEKWIETTGLDKFVVTAVVPEA